MRVVTCWGDIASDRVVKQPWFWWNSDKTLEFFAQSYTQKHLNSCRIVNNTHKPCTIALRNKVHILEWGTSQRTSGTDISPVDWQAVAYRVTTINDRMTWTGVFFQKSSSTAFMYCFLKAIGCLAQTNLAHVTKWRHQKRCIFDLNEHLQEIGVKNMHNSDKCISLKSDKQKGVG